MGTKPAKVGRVAPSSLRGRTKVAKVGPPRARVKSAKVRPTPYVYYPPVDGTWSFPWAAKGAMKTSRPVDARL
eukprot:scaffold28174_cov56-Phaeocystis_antarctica.AAC.2